MNFTRLFAIVSLTIMAVYAQAQNSQPGTLKGKVTTSDGKPAAFVTVLIKEINRQLLTDEDGSFQLSRIAAGTYNLEISLTGFETLQTAVTIQSGQNEKISLQLNLSSKQLQEVTVTSVKNRFIRPQSNYVSKMPLKNLENPAVYTTVTQSLMQDQLTVVYSDALKNVPGVIMQLENNSAGGTVTSRGFSTQTFLRNGLPGIVGGGSIDPANVESIEAIKGPSGALYGASLTSFGGLFNRVTKKPLDQTFGRVGYIGGGFGLSRFEGEINTALDKDHKILARMNAVKYEEGSFQDAGFKNYFFIAPVVSYQVSDKTKLTFELEYKKEKANSFYRLFADGSNATGVSSPRDLKIDWNKRFSTDDIAVNTNTTNVFLELLHKHNEKWQSRVNYSWLSARADGMSGYLSMSAGNQTLTRNTSYNEYANNFGQDLQYNLNGDFHIGKLRNRLLAGADLYFVAAQSSSSGNVAFDVVNVEKPGTAYVALNRLAMLDRVKGNTFTRSRSSQNMYAVYVQDVLNLTDNLLLMASARVDYFDNRGTKNITRDTTTGKYDQTTVSPKFGLVYQIIPDQLSLFTSYSNGFANNAPVLQPDGNTSNFKASQANQIEAGVKLGLNNGKLAGSVSYYIINVDDVTRPDPDKAGYTIQNGTQYSKGIEAEFVATPIKGLNVVGGYAYNDSKMKKSNPNTEGLRPISAGPEHLANLWVSYRFSDGVLKGAGIGIGGNYASENIVINSPTSWYALPAYTALNASISYDQPRFRLIAKIDNLTNKRYFVGWSTTIPQMPARISAGAFLKF